MDRFVYFTIRMRVPDPGGEAAPVSGIIENLATGQKLGFRTADELLHHVSAWSLPVAAVRALPAEPSASDGSAGPSADDCVTAASQPLTNTKNAKRRLS
ncbi:MAG: hypothetical protein L0271_22315 [Gemmatimonadetes bacterium]|nr:hypothetical protein [Gemmatimonadota bacterium]